MDCRVERFFQYIRGKKIAMCGIGVTNLPLCYKFMEKGAFITVCDKRTREQLGKTALELERAGATLSLGENYLSNLDADIIFRTPGMPFFLPELEKARKNGIVVTSEMEVFFDICPAKIIAVTGSDGKTTTTSIIYEMLKAQGRKAHLGGNIGISLLPMIENIGPDDIVVAELSSFQLISMRKSPDIAVITNISPNHLDMHKDMREYIGSKKNIFLHQNAFSRVVLNADNEITRNFVKYARGQALLFSRLSQVEKGAYQRGEDIFVAYKGQSTQVMKTSDILLPGGHNIENYLAAICAVWELVDPEVIKGVAKQFKGVEHRFEFIRELNHVRWYNDSIATTPTRTIAGLNIFDQKIILIAGGYDKQIPFEPLAPKIIEKVKCLILCGDTAEKIEHTVKSCPGYSAADLPIIRVNSMEQAVQKAQEMAAKGDIVALSPACASFDMYPNFEDRGKHFKYLVNALK